LKTDCRILIVDDNALLLTAVGRLLASHPSIKIVAAVPSGREALELVDLLEPDLVLIDLVMPGISGLETTELLAKRPTPPLVVIMSVHDEEPYRMASLRAGADGFLPKSDLYIRLPSLIQELLPSLRWDSGAGMPSTTC
jgi:DNA-binding NarL/FixJ family response regulator